MLEASHRGIKTLLVEQEDYACGASSNSLKTIHGGLRALQSVNLSAVIKGIKERSILLRVAPNYVKPLACMLPTTRALMKSRLIVGSGLLLYNILSLPFSSLEKTRLLSRENYFAWAKGLNSDGVTGGALWYDAQVTNTERLVWLFIKAAVNKGADAINHTKAVKLEQLPEKQNKVLLIRDQLSNDERQVSASCIVDCSAAWNFIKNNVATGFKDDLTFLKSVNVIVRKKLFERALGVNVKAAPDDSSRLYFFSPWRDRTIIGTWYSSVDSYPDTDFSYEEATAYIEEINTAFSEDPLKVEDICNVHVGFLPAADNPHADPAALDQDLISSYQFKDWSAYPGMSAVFSLRGTKYTLARHDAKHVVDDLAKDMGWKISDSSSEATPIYQAAERVENRFSLNDEVMHNLSKNYGEDIKALFLYIEKDERCAELIPGTRYHIRAEIYFSVYHEQALTLTDLLKRRLDTGDREPPEMRTAEYCALLMQDLLSWSEKEMQTQIKSLYDSYPDFLLNSKQAGWR